MAQLDRRGCAVFPVFKLASIFLVIQSLCPVILRQVSQNVIPLAASLNQFRN